MKDPGQKTDNQRNYIFSLVSGLCSITCGTCVLFALSYINSPEFNAHDRVRRAIKDYQYPGSPEDFSPVNYVDDDQFDQISSRTDSNGAEILSDGIEPADHIFDEWDMPNTTVQWMDLLNDIGIDDVMGMDWDGPKEHSFVGGEEDIMATEFTLSDDDVQAKQSQEDLLRRKNKRNKKPREINWARMKAHQLSKVHDKMMTEYDKRFQKLVDFVSNSNDSFAVPDPEKTNLVLNPKYVNYTGFHTTAPVINNFLNDLNCKPDGETLFKGTGRNNIIVLFPGGINLFAEKTKIFSDYTYFWDWFIDLGRLFPVDRFSSTRFSLGVYSNNAGISPRGYRSRANIPWDRLSRFYVKPRMTAVQPKMFSSLRTVLSWLPRFGKSSPAAGDNCIFFWFFHDIPRDLTDFWVPEEYEQLLDLHAQCNLIPIIISPYAKNDAWKSFVAHLVPGLKQKFAKDPDFSGAYFLESHEELESDYFRMHVKQYLCLLENRVLCKFTKKGWIPAPTQPPTVVPDDFRAVYDEQEMDKSEYEYYEVEADVEGPTEKPVETTTAVPEMDMCCGHNQYHAKSYDANQKTCCEDGTVKPYLDDGLDPCIPAEVQ